MLGFGDVAGGVDGRVAGAQCPVHEHAPGHLEAGLAGQLDVRGHADADDDDVGVDRGAVGETYTFDVVGADDGVHACPKAQVDAMAVVQRGEIPPDFGAEHPLEWC